MTFLMWNHPMTEIPTSLIAFQRLFPDDDACARWLIAARWPNGFRCPACGHDRGWELKTRKHSFECIRCHRQTSATAGTLLHRTKLSLATWFRAACLMATIRSCSAKDLGSFVVRNTAATATIKTDGWRGCSAVPRDRHQPHVVGDRPAHEVLAWIHTAFCNLKGWARGVCHGLRAKRLQTCLDEFVFRFNRRRNRHAAFLSLFLQALRAKPHPYRILIKPEPNA